MVDIQALQIILPLLQLLNSAIIAQKEPQKIHKTKDVNLYLKKQTPDQVWLAGWLVDTCCRRWLAQNACSINTS